MGWSSTCHRLLFAGQLMAVPRKLMMTVPRQPTIPMILLFELCPSLSWVLARSARFCFLAPIRLPGIGRDFVLDTISGVLAR